MVSREGNEAMLRRVKRTKLLEKRIRRTWEHGLSGPDCRATDDVLFSCDRERGKRDHPARFDYPDDRGQTGAAWRGDGDGRPSCHQCCCSVLTTHCSANGQRRRVGKRTEAMEDFRRWESGSASTSEYGNSSILKVGARHPRVKSIVGSRLASTLQTSKE